MAFKLTDPRNAGNTGIEVSDIHAVYQQVVFRKNGNMDITFFLYNNKADFEAGVDHFDFLTLSDMDSLPAVENALDAAILANPDFPAAVGGRNN